MRPVLFLDVDGVLNKVGDISDEDGFQDFQMAMCGGFRITHSQQMAKRLAALDVDIVWLTTWCELANEHIGPLFGWDELPVVGRDHWANSHAPWWKSPAAEDYLAENPRPFIWLDDDLYYSQGCGDVEWLASCELPNLCISPASHRGVLPKHLDQIEAWIKNQTTA